MKIRRHFESFDFLLMILVLAAAAAGVVIIGSATRINLGYDRSSFNTQIIWAATGFALLLIAAFVDYNFICKFYIPVYIVNIFLLILVLALDRTTRGVARWIKIGSFGIQPSEFAKIFLIIFMAKFIDKKKEKINNILIFLSSVALIILPAALIFIQPSLSACVVILVIGAYMLYVGGLSYKKILITLAIILPVLAFLYFDFQSEAPLLVDKLFFSHQYDRFKLLFNPEYDPDAYRQTQNSLHAIGSGMLTGKGLFGGPVNQAGYIYASYNDFVLAVIGEEFGFIGCMAMLLLMFFIIAKCFIIAWNSPDVCGKLIASGVACMFLFQTFVNVGVATDLMPNTGMPFPFVSYGGSSMWINMTAVGLVMNVKMSKSKSIFERG